MTDPQARAATCVEACSFKLHKFLVRRAAPSAVEDLKADIFRLVVEKADEIPEDESQQMAWLFRLARGKLSNHHRGNKRERKFLELLQRELRPRQPIEGRSDVVLEALERVPQQQRELLQLAIWDELTHAQIAEIVGKSLSWVDHEIPRAQRRFEKEHERVSRAWQRPPLAPLSAVEWSRAARHRQMAAPPS